MLRRTHPGRILAALFFLFSLVLATSARADTLATFLPDLDPAKYAEGADAFGPIRDDIPVAPVLKGGMSVSHSPPPPRMGNHFPPRTRVEQTPLQPG